MTKNDKTSNSALAPPSGLETPQAAMSPMRLEGTLAFSIEGFLRASSLGKSFIYEKIASGELRTVKHGKRRLILADDARAFLRGCTAGEAVL
ncbi:MAG: hypothetical protein ACHQRJ_05130 [Alphaproteobacteria bacterium]